MLGTRRFTLKVPPDARYAGYVRSQIVALAREIDASPAAIADFANAIGEALANAIEHSRTVDAIEIRCSANRKHLQAIVTDHGCGFDEARVGAGTLPNALSERGRGLAIMERCCDVFEIESVPGRGTKVVLGVALGEPVASNRSRFTALRHAVRMAVF